MNLDYTTGDIIVFSSNVGTKKDNRQHLGMIYESCDNGYQILSVTSEKNLRRSSRIIRIMKSDLCGDKLRTPLSIDIKKIMFVERKDVLALKGQVKKKKLDSVLRQITSNVVRHYYRNVHSGISDFMPGATYVRYGGRVYDADEMVMMVDSSLDFWLTAGRYAKKFEKKFAEFLGTKHCILTNSGSSANLLAIASLTSSSLRKRRLEEGDEIITTACCFPTTVNPIVQNNLVPVFIDVSLGDYNIQVEKIEPALSGRTKAIFLSHTLGNPFNLDKVMEIAKKHALWVIEDNCDSLGSLYRGRYTGTFGHIATHSFYPPHHITMGEGGALATSDNTLHRIILSFRDWGRDCWCEPGCDDTCKHRFGWKLGTLPYGYDHKYIYSHLGYNLRVTDMQAAIGVAQLRKLPKFIKARRDNWCRIYDGIKDLEKFFILPKITEHAVPSWFGLVLTVRKDAPFSKNDIVSYLEDNRIATRMLFAGNIIRQPYFHNTKYRLFGDLKNTDFIMCRTFWVGVYPGITRDMVSYMIEKIRTFAGRF